MKAEQYERFYKEVGAANGWDFSRLSVETDGEAWRFEEVVGQACRPADLLLDIGTGGGEWLLQLAHTAHLLIGIDQSPEMIRTALENERRSGRSNVRFYRMNAEELQFPDEMFQVVSSRQAPFEAREVYRVLADGGLFLTQQVAEDDKRNLKLAFGRSQHGDAEPGTLRDRCLAQLEQAGFRDVCWREYDAAEYYATYEDLVFLLKHTPIIPDFGTQPGDFRRLERLIEENRTERGIRTNAKRFLIQARK